MTLRCIACGTDHDPTETKCSDEGMGRQIARMGARQWNRITAQLQKSSKLNRANLAALRAEGLLPPSGRKTGPDA